MGPDRSLNRARHCLCLVLTLLPALSAAGPLTWFCPLDPLLRPEVGYSGSPEYMSLFTPDAPWPNAASHVDVFKIYPQWITRATDSDLQRIFAELNRRGIALGLEFGLLTQSDTCGRGVEGFGGPAALGAARRIKANGGVLRYVAMDEPFYFGSLYTQKTACRWSAQQVAADAVQNLKAFQSEFPDVIIGDIEPVPAQNIPGWLDRYSEWMDAFRSAFGSNLAFFHADVLWDDPNWRVAVNGLRQAARDRGIAFGMIYNGNGADQTDADWINHAAEHFVDYELRGGQPPDHVIFQSWHAHPVHLLPETDAASFTNLIDRYFRTRTRLTMASDRSRVKGQLTDAAGKALAGLPVKLAASSSRGKGLLGDYTISGTVPASATSAVLGFRVNLECNCSGTSEFMLYGFDYTESAAGTRRDFANGLQGWGLSNLNAVKLEGKALHVSATATQTVILNSSGFSVTPGASYTVRVSAQVAPQSAGSGYFTIIFLADREVSRQRLPIQPLSLDVASTVTAPDGSYLFAVPYIAPDDLQLRAIFAGNQAWWPAEAAVRWREIKDRGK